MGTTEWPEGEPVRGQVLARRYRVNGFLGRGGMGLVYAALDTTSGAAVAVKVPRPEVRNRKKALARFEREARAAVRLRGPNVVRVTDVAELDDGTPFLAMELLLGRDLASELDARGALPVGEAVDIVLEAAAGVAEAHAAGIVHRDLKPHNLFLVDAGARAARTVKVLDFGISKLAGADVPRMTTTNARLGTPLYVSPEQLVSAKYVDARSDVWSLGVILYEVLTGTVPFEGATAIAVAAAIQTAEPAPPSARRPGIPAELDAVVRKALAKDPAKRYANVGEFSSALATFTRTPSAARSEPGRSLTLARAGATAGAVAAGETWVDVPRRETPDDDRGQAAQRVDELPMDRSPELLLALALFGFLVLALTLVMR
jgi:serine/threonine-protein kinase